MWTTILFSNTYILKYFTANGTNGVENSTWHGLF